MPTEYQEFHAKAYPVVKRFIKRVYVLAFNIYAWFALYRLLFIKESTNWEDYTLWFFATAGMYFFVLDNQDVYFRDADGKIIGRRK